MLNPANLRRKTRAKSDFKKLTHGSIMFRIAPLAQRNFERAKLNEAHQEMLKDVDFLRQSLMALAIVQRKYPGRISSASQSVPRVKTTKCVETDSMGDIFKTENHQYTRQNQYHLL